MGVLAGFRGWRNVMSARVAAADMYTDSARLAVAGASLLVIALGAISVSSPRMVAELTVGLLATAIVFWRLLAGIVLFTILTFPAHLPGSLGAGATVAKPLGALIALAWVLALVRDREMPSFLRDRPLVSAGLLAYLSWALLSVLWASDAHRVTSAVVRLAQVLILFFVSYSAVRRPRDVRILAWAYVVAALVTSAYALGSGQRVDGRLTGGVDPNFLAAELVPALIIGAFLLGISRRLVRLLLVSAFETIFVAFALTQSRGGAIALAASLVVAIVVAGPVRPAAIATVLVAVGLAATYYVVIAPAQVRERVTSVSPQASSGRTDSWQVAGEMIQRHPTFGVGLGNFPVVQPSYLTTNLNLIDVRQILRVELVVHNTYLETLAELGIIGLALLLTPIGAIMVRAVTTLRTLTIQGDIATNLIARGVIAGTVGLLVGYVFLSGEYEKQLWLLLGLLAGIGGIVARADAAAALELAPQRDAGSGSVP